MTTPLNGVRAMMALRQQMLANLTMSFASCGHLSIAIPKNGTMRPQVLNLRTGEIAVLRPA